MADLDLVCRKLDDVLREQRAARQVQIDHGKLLARLDERTENQGRRMDRMDRRAGGWGALTGALTGVTTGFLSWLGLGQ